VKTFARRRPGGGHDQVTKFTSVRACLGCGALVLHHQVADFDEATGFKTYSWIPTSHRCTEGKTTHGNRQGR
jgi:hypothetical protein